MTTRVDGVTEGSGGGGGGTPGATGADLYAAATPAAALAALVVVPSLASASGWTTVNGDGVASVPGVARTALGPGVVPASYAASPRVYRPHGLSSFDVDARARIAAWTGGDSASVYASFGLRAGTGTGPGLFLNIRGNGADLSLFADTVSGTGNVGFVTTPTRADLAGGDFWCRIAVKAGCALGLYGIGVGGAEPTEWERVASTSNTTAWRDSYFASLVVALGAVSGGSPDAVTVEWADISARGGPA